MVYIVSHSIYQGLSASSMHVGGFPGASRPVQGAPGASRDLQSPPGLLGDLGYRGLGGKAYPDLRLGAQRLVRSSSNGFHYTIREHDGRISVQTCKQVHFQIT